MPRGDRISDRDGYRNDHKVLILSYMVTEQQGGCPEPARRVPLASKEGPHSHPGKETP